MRYLIAIALLCISQPLFADEPHTRKEMTAEEKAEVRRVINIIGGGRFGRDLVGAMDDVSRALNDHTTEETQGPLGLGAERITQASRELTLATWCLLQIPFAGTTEGQEAQRQWTPAEWIVRANFHLGRAEWRIEQALEALEPVEEIGNVSRAINRLNRVRDVGQVPEELTFKKATPESYPLIIGPHGGYDATQAQMVNGTFYIFSYSQSLIAAYRSAPPLDDYAGFHRALTNGTRTLYSFLRGSANMAGVAFEGQQDMDRFDLVLAGLSTWTEDASRELRFSFVYLRDVAFQLREHEPELIENAMFNRFNDAWFRLDAATWEVLEFPEGRSTN